MVWLVIWIVMAVVVGSIAKSKGRDPIIWGLYGFVIWPLALIHIALMGPVAVANPGTATRACPHCAEQILPAAVKCKHCGGVVEPLPKPKEPDLVA